jgi:epoxyqueuosine reductase QueG
MLNEKWEQYIKSESADFVYFVDISSLHDGVTAGYPCAILFGRALPREFLIKQRQGLQSEVDYFVKGEHDMDALADTLAEKLTDSGYPSLSQSEKANFDNNRFSRETRSSFLPHKTIALMEGFGFIGKNNLLINSRYGCGVVLGTVLTTAPFDSVYQAPEEPKCGSCTVCIDVCDAHALRGTTWTQKTSRDDMMDVSLCNCALACMLHCPYTVRYTNG